MNAPLLIKVGQLLPLTEQGSKRQQSMLVEDGVIRAIDVWSAFGGDYPVVDASRYTAMPASSTPIRTSFIRVTPVKTGGSER